MAFMDDVLGKMSQAGQSVSKKARDLSEYAKYSSTISDSETEIRNLYSEIGYKVYLAYRNNPLPEVAPQIQRISALNKIIEDARAAQKALSDSEKCPRCGTRIRPGMLFCNNCGCRLAEPAPQQGAPAMQAPARFCMSCGAPMAPDALFCMSCGARFEAKPAQAAPEASTPPKAPAAPAQSPVENRARVNSTLAQPTTEDSAPVYSAPAQSTVEDSAPVYSAPAQSTVEDSAPVYSVPEEPAYAYAEPETPDAQQD